MPSLPSLITNPSLTRQVGAFVPLSSIGSVVQTLSNLQGFSSGFNIGGINIGAFSSIAGSIQGALQGFDEGSNILSNFSPGSALGAVTNSLLGSGLAGSSIAGLAGQAASAFNQASSFLNSVGVADSFAKLSGARPSVEAMRAASAQSGLMQFPSDLGKYWIALSFTKYSNYLNNAVKAMPGSSIILPVPLNLTDADSLQYTVFSGSAAAASIIGNAAKGAAEVAGAKSGGAMGGALAGMGADAIAGLAGDLAKTMGVDTGLAINTHQSLQFVQPVLKKHSFQWKLVPSSQKESETIQNMIKAIKKHIYPKANLAVFDYPDLVHVYLFNADKMYMFKPAFVESFSVNYTNETGPAFYKSNYPLAVTISMEIQENSVWTSDEFTGGSYASIQSPPALQFNSSLNS